MEGVLEDTLRLNRRLDAEVAALKAARTPSPTAGAEPVSPSPAPGSASALRLYEK